MFDGINTSEVFTEIPPKDTIYIFFVLTFTIHFKFGAVYLQRFVMNEIDHLKMA